MNPEFTEIAYVACYQPIGGQAGMANARLIAAAPDLLAALIEVVAVSDRATEIYDRARAAIAKATGGA